MSPFDFNNDDEDFFLMHGMFGNQNKDGDENNEDNNDNDNNPFGCGTIVALVIVMFLLLKSLF